MVSRTIARFGLAYTLSMIWSENTDDFLLFSLFCYHSLAPSTLYITIHIKKNLLIASYMTSLALN